MEQPFVCCYSDTLFSAQAVAGVLACDDDIALVVDTDWLTRYAERTEHPTTDAEKITIQNGVVTRIHREIEQADAYGEYIGMAKFSAAGRRGSSTTTAAAATGLQVNRFARRRRLKKRTRSTCCKK